MRQPVATFRVGDESRSVVDVQYADNFQVACALRNGDDDAISVHAASTLLERASGNVLTQSHCLQEEMIHGKIFVLSMQ